MSRSIKQRVSTEEWDKLFKNNKCDECGEDAAIMWFDFEKKQHVAKCGKHNPYKLPGDKHGEKKP